MEDDAKNEDEDVIVLSQGSAISQESVTVTIGNINKSMDESRTVKVTKSSKGNRKQVVEIPNRKKRLSGAERKKRKRAKAESIDDQSAHTEGNQGGTNGGKRRRSKGDENVTPPAKRPPVTNQQVSQRPKVSQGTPTQGQAKPSFANVVAESLTYVIVGEKGQDLNSDQVSLILGNVVRELERFVGTTTTAPSFKGKKVGELELELRCADTRAERWLQWVVPRPNPWEGASLRLIRKEEWETERQSKMVRVSVVVPWRTTGNYFLDILRSNNPNLRTRCW